MKEILRRRERGQRVPLGILYAKSCSRAYVNGIEIRQKQCNTVAGEYCKQKEIEIEEEKERER